MANIILAKCIEKLRNDKGIIQSYRLVDTKGHIGLMGAEQLKQGIRAGRIRVVNLTLTSDNRLVDGATEKKKAKTIVVRKDEPSKHRIRHQLMKHQQIGFLEKAYHLMLRQFRRLKMQ